MSAGVQDKALPTTAGDQLDLSPRAGGTAGSRRMAARMAARDLRRHPWRTLLVLLLIGLPVFGLAFGSTLIASDQASSQEQLHRQLWGFDGVVAEIGFPPGAHQAPDSLHRYLTAQELEGLGIDPGMLGGAEPVERVCPDSAYSAARTTQTDTDTDPLNMDPRPQLCSASAAAEKALRGDGETVVVGETYAEVQGAGAPIGVTVVIADFTREDLIGEGRRFDRVSQAPGADSTSASASRSLHAELSQSADRARARGLEEQPADRVTLRLQDGSEVVVPLAGTMEDRASQFVSIGGYLSPEPQTTPHLFVQAGTPAAERLMEDADERVYLTGSVPTEHRSYLPFTEAGLGVLFSQVPENSAEIQAVFDAAWTTTADWSTLLPLLLLGVLALAETGLLAGAAFAVGARQQQRATALLSVSGAEPATLRQTMVFSGLWCGLIAAGAGALLGLLAGCGVVWAAEARGIPTYGPHVMWPAVLGAVVLGLVCAVVAAWVPAHAVARQDAWAALKGASGARRPISRRLLVTGLVVTSLGLAGVVGATLYGMAVPTVGDLQRSLPTLAVVLMGGTAVLLAGVLMLLPGIVTGVARAAGRLPVTLRMAARDAHRNRSRTVPIAAAVVAATAVGTLALTAMASLSLQAVPPTHGSPSTQTAQIPVEDIVSVRQQVENQRTNGAPDATAASMRLFQGEADGVLEAVQETQSVPGTPHAVQSWEVHRAVPECSGPNRPDCHELAPLYPEISICHLPIPEHTDEAARRQQIWTQMEERPRQEAARCGQSTSFSSFGADGLRGLLVVDPDRPETMPQPVLRADPQLNQALEAGKAVVFDPELISPEGTVTLGEFGTDPTAVPGMASMWTDDVEQGGMPGLDGWGTSAIEGRHPVWEPARTVTLDAVQAEPLPGDTPVMVLPVTALDGLEQRMGLTGVLLEYRDPLTSDQVKLMNDELIGKDLQFLAMGEEDRGWEVGLWVATALMALIIITVAGITTGLALADARRDQTVLSSIGANPSTRKSMAAAQTFVAALSGTALGVPVGALALVGLGLVQAYDVSWVPWWQLVVLVVGVPLLSAALTWLVVPGRLPIREADRD